MTVRPNSDVTTSGWSPSAGVYSYDMLDEGIVSDLDYTTSPTLGTGVPIIMGLSASLSAGTHYVTIRLKSTTSAGYVRISLLNSSNVVQGISAWQAVTGTYTNYTLPVTISGTANRISIETSVLAVPPTLLTATIPVAGNSISLVFSEKVTSTINTGFLLSMSAGASTITYASGSGTTTLVYNLGRTINSGETGVLAYTQPGNGIEATVGSIDLVTFTNKAVINNSTTNEVMNLTEFVENTGATNSNNGGRDTGWGGHQVRIVEKTNGDIYALYIYGGVDSGSNRRWQIMKRIESTGVWSSFANGQTQYDVHMIRHPQTDTVHVFAYPNFVWTVYSELTNFVTGVTVRPGEWHGTNGWVYTGCGIGTDGTMVLQSGYDYYQDGVATKNTEICCTSGTFNGTSWAFTPVTHKIIGLRYSYDYIFPGGNGNASEMVGVHVRDVLKFAAGITNDPSNTNYTWDGVKYYKIGTSAITPYSETDVEAQRSPDNVLYSGTTCFMFESDAICDNQGRMWILHNTDKYPTNNDATAGTWLTIINASGTKIHGPTKHTWASGYTRLYEDSQNRMWAFTISGSSPGSLRQLDTTTFSAGNAITYGSFTSYPQDDRQFIACTRSGSAKKGYITGMYTNGSTVHAYRIKLSNTPALPEVPGTHNEYANNTYPTPVADVTDPLGSGLTMHLHTIENNQYPSVTSKEVRAEKRLLGTLSNGGWTQLSGGLLPGVDYWFSIVWHFDPTRPMIRSGSTGSMLIWQTHAHIPGDTGPDIACYFQPNTNQMYFRASYDTTGSGTRNDSALLGTSTLPASGQRVRQIVHYRPGWTVGHAPVFQVWQAIDDANFDKLNPLVNYTGFNTYNYIQYNINNSSNYGPSYLRKGPYKWSGSTWTASTYSWYMSNWHFGVGTDLFEEAKVAIEPYRIAISNVYRVSATELLATQAADTSIQALGTGLTLVRDVSETTGVISTAYQPPPALDIVNGNTMRFGRVDDPDNAARKVFYFAGSSNDVDTKSHKRSEIQVSNSNVHFIENTTYWLAIELKISNERLSKGGDGNLMQVHTSTSGATIFGPCALVVSDTPTKSVGITYRWATSPSGTENGTVMHEIPNYPTTWQKWVIKFRCDGNHSLSNGLLQAWYQSENNQVVNYTGNLGLNDSNGYYLKFGLDDYSGVGAFGNSLGVWQWVRSCVTVPDAGYTAAQIFDLLT